jgi:hypothetical protein
MASSPGPSGHDEQEDEQEQKTTGKTGKPALKWERGK